MLSRSIASVSATRLGVWFMLTGIALYTAMDVLIKLLSETYPVGQIVFFRSVFAFLPLLYLIGKAGGWHSLATSRLRYYFARSLVGTTAMFLFFWSYALLPLPEVSAIGQSAPILQTALAAIILKEGLSGRRSIAIFIGFLGVLVITQPGTALFQLASLVPLAAAFFYAFGGVVTRALTFSEPNHRISFYFFLFASLAGLLTWPLTLIPSDWLGFLGLTQQEVRWVLPDLPGFLMLALLGVIGGLSQMAIVKAFSLAPASLLAPFDYIGLPLAMLLGYLIWGDLLNLGALIGAAIIVGSGLYIFRHADTKAHSPATSLPPLEEGCKLEVRRP